MPKKKESREILEQEIRRLEALGYEQLRGGLEGHQERELVGSSGDKYLVCIDTVWDDKPEGNLRLFVEARNLSRFWSRRVTDDLLIAPDSSTDFPKATFLQRVFVKLFGIVVIGGVLALFAALFAALLVLIT